MPYANSATLISIEGGSFPQVTAKLWMLWTVVGSGSGTGRQQMDMESVALQSGATFSFSFNQGPSNEAVSRGIGLSLQDTGLASRDMGWWFRSGRFEGPLPTEPIEIVLSSPVALTPADLTASMPTVPFNVSGATTITSLSVTPADDGTIAVAAAGTTTESPLAFPVNFTYALTITLEPSSDIAAAQDEVIVIGAPNRGTISFSGTSLPAMGEAAFLNLVSEFILREIFPMFRRTINARLNAGLLSTLAGMIAPGTTTLPAGIIVSVRTISTRSTGVTVRGALGAFGGVFSKLPPLPTVTTTRCPLQTLQALLLPTLQLSLFRAVRDQRLASDPLGTQMTGLYYNHSAEVSRILLRSPALALQAAALLPELQARLGSDRPIPDSFKQRCERVIGAIARRGSDRLRVDVEWALAHNPWQLLSADPSVHER